MSDSSGIGLFGALFDRGAVDVSDQAWLQAMLDTEAALARAAERAGLAPAGSGAAVTAVARSGFFDNGALGAAAAATGNPVPALVRALTRLLPESAAGAAAAVHRGATSQDIIDTAIMLLARQGIAAILADLRVAAAGCAARASEHADTVMSGRTLLQQAVPVTFGLVAAGWLTAIDEARRDLHRIRTGRLAVQFGGAAGTLASLGDAGPGRRRAAGRRTRPGRARAALAHEPAPDHRARRRPGRRLRGPGQDRPGCHPARPRPRSPRPARVAGPGAAAHPPCPTSRTRSPPIVVLGCAKQAPGLLATLAAAGEQEHQRAAGAWHAEWLPLTTLVKLTGSASAWTADLLTGLQIDPAAMRANANSTHGLPQSEHLAALLSPRLGPLQAHDLLSKASARAAADGIDLADALLTDPEAAALLSESGLARADIDAALRPESYLGATAEFIRRALAAHEDCDTALNA